MDYCIIIFNLLIFKLYITEFTVQDGGTSTLMWQYFEQLMECLKQ